MSDHRPRWASRTARRTAGLLAALVALGLATRPSAAEGAASALIGLSVLVPPGTSDVALVATGSDRNSVRIVDDGSIAIDRANDGEWIGAMALSTQSTTVDISGSVDGIPVSHQESLRVPQAWFGAAWPVTYRLVRTADGYELRRLLFNAPPPLLESDDSPVAALVGGGLGLSGPAALILAGLAVGLVGWTGRLRRQILDGSNTTASSSGA